MNDDWKNLEDAWKASSPVSSSSASAVKSVRSHSHFAIWRLSLVALAACSTIAIITSWCMLHRSIQGFTFTVIAWSAFFSFGSYLLSTRESPSDLAQETTTALERRAKSLTRGAQLLDFGRTLIGVETILCLGFWIALHHHDEPNSMWRITASIVFCGLGLYMTLARLLAKTRRELGGLESIAAALRKA